MYKYNYFVINKETGEIVTGLSTPDPNIVLVNEDPEICEIVSVQSADFNKVNKREFARYDKEIKSLIREVDYWQKEYQAGKVTEKQIQEAVNKGLLSSEEKDVIVPVEAIIMEVK